MSHQGDQVDALKRQIHQLKEENAELRLQCTLHTPENGYTVVFVPCIFEQPMTQVTFTGSTHTELMAQLKDRLNADPEFHVTAYYHRDELSTPELRTLHENLVFTCDEDGYHAGKGTNVRASQITGIQCLGDCIFFLGKEEEDEPRANLTLEQIQ